MTSQPSLRALITGASGIGKTSAIVLLSRAPDKLDTVAEVPRQHGDQETVRADFDGGAMLSRGMVALSILHTVVLPSGAVIDELTLIPAIGTVSRLKKAK